MRGTHERVVRRTHRQRDKESEFRHCELKSMSLVKWREVMKVEKHDFIRVFVLHL